MTSVTSDLSAGYNSPTCAWSNRALKKLKNFQKIASGDDFSQKVGFWPPQPAKNAIHEVSTKMGPYTKSFFHHFQATCKVSSTSDGSFPRSQNFLHPGSLVKGILSGRAPYPANLGKTCYLNVWTRPPSSVRCFASRQAVKLGQVFAAHSSLCMPNWGYCPVKNQKGWYAFHSK